MSITQDFSPSIRTTPPRTVMPQIQLSEAEGSDAEIRALAFL